MSPVALARRLTRSRDRRRILKLEARGQELAAELDRILETLSAYARAEQRRMSAVDDRPVTPGGVDPDPV